MKDTTADERRRSPRIVGEQVIRFEGENFSIYSRALNTSETGAFIATHYLLDPGTPLQLHLTDASGIESMTHARVVRTTTEKTERGEATLGMGIEYVDDPTSVD